MPRPLILASTSPYRRTLLARLRIPFSVVKPEFAEEAAGGGSAETLVRVNTLGKGREVFSRRPDARVIASDQLVVCEGRVLGKAGDAEAAVRQLQWLSGKAADFMTGLAVIAADAEHYERVTFRVYFRQLSLEEISTYVNLEKPWDCAGSFKMEGLGISLFERLEGDDPTALMGLPLIRLCSYLHPLGLLAKM
jgi:septum formation protein